MRDRARTRSEKPDKKPKPKPQTARRPTPKAVVASRPKPEKPEVRIFVSYSHRDADARTRLETHLAPLKRDNVETWFDGEMSPGDKLDTGIARALRDAHIFVALLSPEYLASNYCWKIEYRRAMKRRAKGTMRVIAAVVRPCDWKATPAAGFKLLPEDGRDVTKWRSADEAYLNIAQGIRRVVIAVRKDMVVTAARAPAKNVTTAPKKTAAVSKEAAPKPTSPKPGRNSSGPRATPRKPARRPRA